MTYKADVGKIRGILFEETTPYKFSLSQTLPPEKSIPMIFLLKAMKKEPIMWGPVGSEVCLKIALANKKTPETAEKKLNKEQLCKEEESGLFRMSRGLHNFAKTLGNAFKKYDPTRTYKVIAKTQFPDINISKFYKSSEKIVRCFAVEEDPTNNNSYQVYLKNISSEDNSEDSEGATLILIKREKGKFELASNIFGPLPMNLKYIVECFVERLKPIGSKDSEDSTVERKMEHLSV